MFKKSFGVIFDMTKYIKSIFSIILFTIVFLFNYEITVLLNEPKISNWLYFVPTINNTRDDTELDELTKNKKFKWLHLGSVIFYVLSMFLSISLIVL